MPDWANKLKKYRKTKADQYAKVIIDAPKKASLYSTIRFPGVMMIMGDIRTGKTALAHDIARQLHTRRNLPAILHLPTIQKEESKRIQGLLPKWMKVVSRFSEWGTKAVVIYDEAAQSAHSRRSQSGEAIELDELLALAGQRELLILFISHYSRKLDLNVCTSVHRIIWKRPTFAHQIWERDEMADFTGKAYDFFRGIKTDAMRKHTCLILDMDNFGFYQASNKLPPWWSDDISKVFKNHSAIKRKKGGIYE